MVERGKTRRAVHPSYAHTYPSSSKATACTYVRGGVSRRPATPLGVRGGAAEGRGGVSHLYAFVGLHSRVACSHVAAAATNPPSVRSEGTHAGTPVDIPLPKSHVLVVGRGEVKFAYIGTRDHVIRARSRARRDLPRRGSRGKKGRPPASSVLSCTSLRDTIHVC